MRILNTLALVGVSALSLSACGGSGGASNGGARDFVRVVGSSTVYPFATAVAETAVKASGIKSPVIESTGTGAGMKLFCAGVGAAHPDIENASRRMKASEYADCAKNGAKDIVEIQVGLDGIAFASAKGGITMPLFIRRWQRPHSASLIRRRNGAM
jgi:phosphate transport system substrate-binding protein